MTFGKIGARNLLRYWRNPYVTNGLIAMWDGEWNAGGGKHDPNATVWKDLSGNGRELTVVQNENIVWHPKCFSNVATVPGYCARRDIDDALLACGQIECVFSQDAFGAGYASMQTILGIGTNQSNAKGIFTRYSNVFYVALMYSNSQRSIVRDGYGIKHFTSAAYNTDVSVRPSSIASYKNAVLQQISGKSYDVGLDYSGVYIFGSGRSGRADAIGSIYCIRVYSRNLTA